MGKTMRLLSSGVLCSVLALPVQASAQVPPPEHQQAAVDGADRLMFVQFSSGALPWIVGNPGEYQNVQGITAQGFIEALKVSGNLDYLGSGKTGAEGVRNWLAGFMKDNPSEAPSSPNVYFLAEYALLTLDTEDLNLAREALGRSLDRFDDEDDSNGGPATDLVRAIVTARKNQGHTNLGIWDAALFIRAAHDVGDTETAAEMAQALIDSSDPSTGIVDRTDDTANWYEIGLTGILFGLSESDSLQHLGLLQSTADALEAEQQECFGDGDPETDGSFPVTYGGGSFCGDVQTSAYAVLGLTSIGRILPSQDACNFLASGQDPNTGGWDLGGYEIAEVDSEAVQALAACVLPTRNGATSYGDAAIGAL